MPTELYQFSINIEDLSNRATHDHDIDAIDWYLENRKVDPSVIADLFKDNAIVVDLSFIENRKPEEQRLAWSPRLLFNPNDKARIKFNDLRGGIRGINSTGVIQFAVGAAMCHIENDRGQDKYFVPCPRRYADQDVLFILTKKQFEEILDLAKITLHPSF